MHTCHIFSSTPALCQRPAEQLFGELSVHVPSLLLFAALCVVTCRLLKESVVLPLKYPQLFTGLLAPWRGGCLAAATALPADAVCQTCTLHAVYKQLPSDSVQLLYLHINAERICVHMQQPHCGWQHCT
jgi:hypothetical protein